jgi:membrane-associated phospholipid phosphatase
MYWVYWAPFIAVYQATNRWPLVPPVELPMTWIDRAVPFVPALIPLYVAYLPLYWTTAIRSEDDVQANRLFYAAYLQLLVSLPFFLLYPIQMPREVFYAPEAYGWADAFWRWFDAPNNCFPSLHVSNCLLLAHFNWRRRLRWLFVPVSVAVIASTVLVKQHYAVDLLGGAAVYLVSVGFLRRLELGPEDDRAWARQRPSKIEPLDWRR